MGQKMQQLIDQAEQDLLHTYNRYQIVLDHGEGVYLYDVEGKKYLDFVAGIAVFALGEGSVRNGPCLLHQQRGGIRRRSSQGSAEICLFKGRYK